MATDSRKKPLNASQLRACENLRAIWNKKKDELGLTQESAAEAMGVGQSAVSHNLRGRTAIGLKALLRWSELLEVETHEIDPDIANESIVSFRIKTLAPSETPRSTRIAAVLAELELDGRLDQKGADWLMETINRTFRQ